MKKIVLNELAEKWERDIRATRSEDTEEGNDLQNGLRRGRIEALESCRQELKTLNELFGE